MVDAADESNEAARGRPRAEPLPRGALRRGRGALRARADARPGQPGLDRPARQGRRPTPPPRSTCSSPSCASSTPTRCSRRHRSHGSRARGTSPATRTGAGSATWVGPRASGTSAARCSRRSCASSAGATAAGCGRAGTARASTPASSRSRTCASTLDRHNLKSTYPAGRQRRLRAAGPHPAGGRDPLPHRRRLVEQPRQPEGGRGRHPLPAQRRQLARSGARPTRSCCRRTRA